MDEQETTTGTALAEVPVEERGLRGLDIAETMFPEERRAQVAALLTVPKDSPALLPFLALCVAENFSPWANHVWLIPKTVKIKGADGEQDREEEKHIPMVGRDGLLHKARQTKGAPGGFRGIQAQVVCERDSFEVSYTGDMMSDPVILHRFASKPTAFDEGVSPDRYRGRVIGAWAKVLVDGEPPTFFFANVREYAKTQQEWAYNPSARTRTRLYVSRSQGTVTFTEFEDGVPNPPKLVPAGAWDYISSMILKAAQSYVLRIALGVTGFVPYDELRDVSEWQRSTGRPQAPAAPEAASFDFSELPAPEELRERLERAVDEANEMEAFSWSPAKCAMVMQGRTADELAAVAKQIEGENDVRRRREEKIEDATVVLTPEQQRELDELRNREADAVGRLDACEDDGDRAAVQAELDQIRAAIQVAERGQG